MSTSADRSPQGVNPAVTGAWHPRESRARRRFAALGELVLEGGAVLPEVVVAYETFGERAPDGSNVVLIEHALTGDAHVAGSVEAGQRTPGWWDEVVGPGKAVDTDHWFVVCANVLGGCQGTTGPSSLAEDGLPYGSRWPRITVRDQVEAEVRLANALGIERFAAVIGGSMGGMRVLEWAYSHPQRVGVAVALATSAAASADQIGTQTAQMIAITNDPNWNDGDYYDSDAGPDAGMGLARRIAHLTYRTDIELDDRFGREYQDSSEDPLFGPAGYSHERDSHRFAVQSYLDYHAEKLNARFDAGTYVALTDAMNTHDLGRGRGGLLAALQRIEVPLFIAGVDTDRLYPLRQQQFIADSVSSTVRFDVIVSQYGHDGFLIESEQVGDFLRRALAVASDQLPA